MKCEIEMNVVIIIGSRNVASLLEGHNSRIEIIKMYINNFYIYEYNQ